MVSRSSLAVGVVLLVGAGCSVFDGAEERTFTDGGSTIVQMPSEDRDTVDFPESARGIDGERLPLAKLATNKVVVLNVWASWCGPCIKEAESLRRADERFDDSQVVFIGVNIRDNDANARAFVRKHGVGYPNVSDPSSEQLGELSRSLTFGVPTTAVVGADGRLAALVKGEASTATITALVEDALAER